MKTVMLAIVLLGLLIFGRILTPTQAQTCATESEPNNEPSDANDILICVAGVLDDQDQDLYWLEVDSSSQLFEFTLTGMPEGLTRMQLVLPNIDEDGNVTGLNEFGDLPVYNGDTKTAPIASLLPGRYLLGVSGAGRLGRYHLNIATSQLPALNEVTPNDVREEAQPISAGADVIGDNADGTYDWYLWTVEDDTQRWRVSLDSVVGNQSELTLYPVGGSYIQSFRADIWGRVMMPDLQLPAGEYYLQVNNWDDDPEKRYALRIESMGAASPLIEAEPNDFRVTAPFWDSSQPLAGRIMPGEVRDHFKIVVPSSDMLQRIQLESDAPGRYEVCVYDAADVRLQCRTGLGLVMLPDLALSAESPTHTVSIYNATPTVDEAYTISLVEDGAVDSRRESEPNDQIQLASPIDASGRIAGTLDEQDIDMFRLTTSGEVQLWRIQLLGEGAETLRLINSTGTRTHEASDSGGRVRLPNVLLPIGDHYIEVRGEGDYQLLFLPLGPAPKGFEHEANDTIAQANIIELGVPRSGFLNADRDTDYYRFALDSASKVRLSLVPPSDGSFTMALYWEQSEITRLSHEEVGEPLEMELALAAGDYQLGMWVNGAASADLYSLQVELLDPLTDIIDLEPINNDHETATELPATLRVIGELPNNDRDVYRLPTLREATHVTIENPDGVDVRIYDFDDTRQTLEQDDSGTLKTAEKLTPDHRYYLYLASGDAYDLTLAFSDGVEAEAPSEPLDATVTLSLEAEQVAAYATSGQVVSGTLEITSNEGGELTLTALSNQPRVVLEVPPVVTVGSGETVVLPVRLLAQPDLPEAPIQLTVAARLDNKQAQTGLEVGVSAELLATNPSLRWPLPPELLGSYNAAATYFGAQPLNDDDAIAERQRNLHDGSSALGDLFRWNEPVTLTVDLAGEQPVPIVGVALNPQTEERANTRLRTFEVWLSADGLSYEKVLDGDLSPLGVEQPFVLDTPTEATHARLVMVDTHGGRGRTTLGEWKVLTSRPLSQTVNLLDPQLGGYVVDVQPMFRSDAARSVLDADERTHTVRTQPNEQMALTVGFYQNRMAQIEQIVWTQPEIDEDTPSVVTVTASAESLIGPWQTVGTFTPASGGLTLDAPTWARFLRFTYPVQSERFDHPLPEQIEVYERTSDAVYRSIVAEWGHYNRAAIFEQLNPPQPFSRTLQNDNDDTLETATPLPIGTQAAGEVLVQEDSDWYAVEVSAESNAVVFELTGEPSVDTRIRVVDDAGNPLPVQTGVVAANRHVVTATVEGGTTVYAQVEEPPRSIVFVWDNSGSVSPYYNEIYNAVNAFTQDVVQGREAVNYVVLGMQSPLLEGWVDDPVVLQRELTNYDRSHNSSDAEDGLIVATNALAFRDGVKAIVLIADAEDSNNNTDELWRALNAVEPRIFTMQVHSTHEPGREPADYQDRMQSWADVNSGYYDWFRTASDLENGFARASTWLRRPKGYGISAELATVEPPGPGLLEVLSSAAGEDDQAAAELLGDTAVELIIDASGSMQQALEGSTRIDVAKTVLDDLVANVLPDGVPVALRAFGNREGNLSCRTDLEIPLAPLERDTLRATIAAIEPQTDANTAIAASLALVETDLADATGQKLVVLLTDGEETCDGDPLATIQALRERGIDIRVNIVGFAIDDAELKATFEEWAQVGGGQYFDAISADELTDSVAQALRVPYRVLDSDGVEVGQGVVDGEPIELPAGVYTVELLTSPTRAIPVTVIGDELVTVGSGQ